MRENVLLRKYELKRMVALDEIKHLNNSLDLMRNRYRKASYYERQQIIKQAESVKQQIKGKTIQYKIHVKENLDDNGREVVDALF
jgi:hypothetical protein